MQTLPDGFGGIVPPVCTPFTEHGQVDTDSLTRLVHFLLDAGVHALFALGSTSETVFLTNAQRAVVLETVVRAVAGRVPVVVGVFDITTARACEHARRAAHAGVAGLVLTVPFYHRYSPGEVAAHFRAVGEAAGNLPVIAYDIPATVHAKIERADLVTMARDGLIAGLKDSSGDEANFRGVLLATREMPGFRVFTGSELVADAALLFGAHGIVPGLGNVDPHGYVRLFEAGQRGDWEAARREQERLYRLFDIIRCGDATRMGFTSSALGGFKTALMLRGVIDTNTMGAPLTRYNAGEVERVRGIITEAGLLA